MDLLSTAFAALADPTRRAIVARLAQGEARVGELGQPFRISAPAISRHLRVLERAGLIEREVDAQWRVCRLRGLGLRAAHDWMAQYRHFWETSLDRLAEHLEQAALPATAPEASPAPPPAPVPRPGPPGRPSPPARKPRPRNTP
jgi:DNA-binding transcriptional ArsR family regulator